MNTTLNEVVVHINETIDDALFSEIENGLRHDPGIVSVGRNHGQAHLMVVIYDSEVAHAADILHTFREHDLHAQLVGM